MDARTQKIYKEIATTAAEYIKNAAKQHLPPSAQKDFILWILADDNPYQNDYLKMLGVASSIELEISMLDTIVHQDSAFKKLSSYLGFLNAYFAFETIQDNLAIGLATWFDNKDPTLRSQRIIVENFNPAMISKLQGNTNATVNLLAPYKDMAQTISAYKRCLSPEKMYKFAHDYGKYCGNAAVSSELDHCFYSILILNIATSLDLLKSLEEHDIYSLLQETLIARYDSVDKLLKSANTASASDLADWGAKAILVLPTLVYCIGALDVIAPKKKLTKTIKDGSLMNAIYNSALLVRLLNDLGTNLLTLNETEQKQLFNDLRLLSKKQTYHSILELLSDASQSPELTHILVRIRKDVQYGEFNICLDNLTNPYDITQSLNEFFEKIIFYSNLYQQYSQKLIESCAQLEKHFSNTQISTFIFNMFKFHEKMYAIKFETKYGDYAVLGAEEKKQ